MVLTFLTNDISLDGFISFDNVIKCKRYKKGFCEPILKFEASILQNLYFADTCSACATQKKIPEMKGG